MVTCTGMRLVISVTCIEIKLVKKTGDEMHEKIVDETQNNIETETHHPHDRKNHKKTKTQRSVSENLFVVLCHK